MRRWVFCVLHPVGFVVKGSSHLDKSPQVLPCDHVKFGGILPTFWPPKTCKTPGGWNCTNPKSGHLTAVLTQRAAGFIPARTTARGQAPRLAVLAQQQDSTTNSLIVKERPHRRCCNMDDCIVSASRLQDRELCHTYRWQLVDNRGKILSSLQFGVNFHEIPYLAPGEYTRG